MMSLSKKQKKYLKKHWKKRTIEEIARHLGSEEKEIEAFFKKNKKKYQKPAMQGKGKEAGWLEKTDSFKFKTWFKKNQASLFVLGLLGFLVYANGLNNEFVSDDVYTFVQAKDFGRLSYAFSSFPVLIRPLAFWLIKNIFGLKPIFYRLVNLFFHLGSTAALFLLVSLLINSQTGFLAGALLAVHPIGIEAVTWISGGPYSQYAFFILLGLIFYLFSRQKRKYYFFSLASFILALSTSEKAVTYPFILFALVLALNKLKKNWSRLAPFFIIGGAWAVFYLLRIPQRFSELQTISSEGIARMNPLTQVPIALSSYLELIFWPKNLALYHTELLFTVFQFSLKTMLVLFYFCLLLISWKKQKQLFFWLSLFVISLLPFLTPWGISWVVAERYVYLGSTGIFTVLALGFKKLLDSKNWRSFATLAFIFLIIALSARTIRRNIDWKNQDNLWLAAAKTSPSSPQNHNNLGDLYGRRGDYEKAIYHFKKAIELKPGYAEAYHNLANIYFQLGQLEEARKNYELCLESNPLVWQSYENLGQVYFEQEEYGKAEELLKRAIAINPQEPSLFLNLAVVYFQQGRVEESKREIKKVLELDPENQKARSLWQEISSQ